MNSILKKISDKRQEGFTIIEVMIVLAIAGVIIAAVLVAVPQLQRNQRNSARRAVLSRVKVEIDNYVSNNNGVPPLQTADAIRGFTGGFAGRYLQGASFNDPNGTAVVPALWVAAGPQIPAGATPAGVMYRVGHICDGEFQTTVGNGRNYAVAIGLEGNAFFCLDNR